jgi:hypothetical protein
MLSSPSRTSASPGALSSVKKMTDFWHELTRKKKETIKLIFVFVYLFIYLFIYLLFIYLCMYLLIYLFIIIYLFFIS